MYPRKGFIKPEVFTDEQKKKCLVHGIFQKNDGYVADVEAIVEMEDGSIKGYNPEYIVFTEKYNKSMDADKKQ